MKKYTAFILALFLLFSFSISFAEEDQFDSSFFKGKSGYEYDKFDKSWSYFKAFSKQYRDAYVVIGLNCSEENNEYLSNFYCWIRDAQNRTVLDSVNEIWIMVGDDIYHMGYVYEGETSSSFFMGPNAKEMIKAMSLASSVTIRLGIERGNMDFEIKGTEYSTTLKEAASNINKSGILDYCGNDFINSLFIIEKM